MKHSDSLMATSVFFGVVAFAMISYNFMMAAVRVIEVSASNIGTYDLTGISINVIMALLGFILLSVFAHIMESGRVYEYEHEPESAPASKASPLPLAKAA